MTTYDTTTTHRHIVKKASYTGISPYSGTHMATAQSRLYDARFEHSPSVFVWYCCAHARACMCVICIWMVRMRVSRTYSGRTTLTSHDENTILVFVVFPLFHFRRLQARAIQLICGNNYDVDVLSVRSWYLVVVCLYRCRIYCCWSLLLAAPTRYNMTAPFVPAHLRRSHPFQSFPRYRASRFSYVRGAPRRLRSLIGSAGTNPKGIVRTEKGGAIGYDGYRRMLTNGIRDCFSPSRLSPWPRARAITYTLVEGERIHTRRYSPASFLTK